MKALIEFLNAWYYTRKELKDLSSYVWSEIRRHDLMCWETNWTPTKRLRIQYNLSHGKGITDMAVWFCLEQFFKLKQENKELIEKYKKLEQRLADINQNQ